MHAYSFHNGRGSWAYDHVGVDMEVNDTIMKSYIAKLRKQYRMINGEDFPAELTDEEIMAAMLVQLIEDYYL